jgi:hypothetical protein
MRRLITPSGVMPVTAFNRWRERNQWYRARLKEIDFLRRDFDKAAAEVYGSVRQMDEQSRLAINEVLGGKADVATLPEPLREPIRQMRQKLDEFSEVLIADGVVEGKLAAKIDEHRGIWLHRQYRAFRDPKWSENVPHEVRQHAKDWLRKEYQISSAQRFIGKKGPELDPADALMVNAVLRGQADTADLSPELQAAVNERLEKREPREADLDLTDDQLENQIRTILYEAEQAGSPISFLSRIGKKNLSILKKRKLDDKPELRALLGEIKDPRTNFIESAQKQAHLIASHRFLTQVRREGLGRFLFEADDPNIPPEAVAKIAAENSETMWPLNGLKTYPEIKDALERSNSLGEVTGLFRRYLQLLAMPKMAATALSEVTQVRNVLSWYDAMLRSGLLWHLGPRNVMSGVRTIANDFDRLSNAERRQRIVRLHELGVLGEGAASGELKDALNAASKGDFARFLGSLQDNNRPFHRRALSKLVRGTGRAVKGTLDTASKLYAAGDNLPRYIFFELEMQRHRKVMPDATEGELEAVVARKIRDTTWTYSMVPELWRKIGRAAPVAPFTSFPYEVVRTHLNNMKLMAEEFQTPGMRGIAAERLAGMMLVPIGIPAISAATRFLSGYDREDDEAIREFMPYYAEDGEYIYKPSDDPLTVTVTDMSYVDPNVYLRGPLMHFLRNDDDGAFRAMASAAGKLFGPFTSEELLVQRVIDWARNRTEFGGKVYNEQGDPDSKVYDTVSHIAKAFEPGTVKQFSRLYKGITGTIEPWGQARNPWHEALSFMGQRPMSIHVPTALGRKASNFQREWSDATTILTEHVRSKGEVSLDTIRDKHDEMVRSKARLFADMKRKIPAATKVTHGHYDEKAIRKTLDDAGLSDQKIDSLFAGQYDADEFAKSEVMRLTGKKADDTSIRFFKAMGVSRAELEDLLRDAWMDRGFKVLDTRTGKANRSLFDRIRNLWERYPGPEGGP